MGSEMCIRDSLWPLGGLLVLRFMHATLVWVVGFSLSELKCKDEMGVRKSCKVGSTLLRARPLWPLGGLLGSLFTHFIRAPDRPT